MRPALFSKEQHTHKASQGADTTVMKSSLPLLAAFTLMSMLLTGGCSSSTFDTYRPPTTPVVVAPAAPLPLQVAEAPFAVEAPRVAPVVSPAIAEIAKLARAGMSEEVMLAFIAQNQAAFVPTAEEIVHLNDLGVSQNVIAALLRTTPGVTGPSGAPVAQTEAAPSAPVPASAPVESAPPSAQVVMQQPVTVIQPQPQVVLTELPEQDPQVVRSFWPSLEPYGTWVQIPSHGWCWRPAVSLQVAGWRPYCDGGRWIHSDQGWYWLSDYSWGWAAFHYGRWFSHTSLGWCWVPDNVWSPAWVSWRQSPEYCGWAPLPPVAHYRIGVGFSSQHGLDFGIHYSHYTFLPVRNLCDSSPLRYRVNGARVNQLYGQSTVINNFHSGSGDIVVNTGLPVDHYTKAGGRNLQRVQLRPLPREGQPDQLQREGDQLVVYRPQAAQLPLPASTPGVDRTRSEARKPAGANPPAPTATGIAGDSSIGAARSADTPSARPQSGSSLPRIISPSSPQAPGRSGQSISSSRNSTTTANPDRSQDPDWLRKEPMKASSGSRANGAARTGMHGIRPEPGIETLSPPQPITSVPTIPGVDSRPLTPPQPITSVPTAPGVSTRPLGVDPRPLGVDTRPFTPPQPLTSVPRVPGIEPRPLSVPQPVTIAPPDNSAARVVRQPGRYEPSRPSPSAEVPRWEQTARQMQQQQQSAPARPVTTQRAEPVQAPTRSFTPAAPAPQPSVWERAATRQTPNTFPQPSSRPQFAPPVPAPPRPAPSAPAPSVTQESRPASRGTPPLGGSPFKRNEERR